MALDTFGVIWNRVLLRCPAASSFLARDWVTNAFRQIAERRRWSWLIKYGQFLVPAVYNTGQVTATRLSPTIIGNGTGWDTSLVGRQFRIATNTPIYTITAVTNTTSLELDNVWAGANTGPIGYEIYQCYFTPPSDFHALMTVWDPAMNWQLWRHIQQGELNTWDAQRANRGQAYVVASFDYTQAKVGSVAPVLQVSGPPAAPAPVSGGTYNGPNDADFVLQVTAGGTFTTAVFSWRKDNGPLTTGVVAGGNYPPQLLQDGVEIIWPEGYDYLYGTVWLIHAHAGIAAGLPRYEIWPHQTAQYVYPFLYEARAQDLGDPSAVLPRYIRGDVLLEMALAEAARWPGPSTDKLNPYRSDKLSQIHEARAERMIMELERQDDNTYEQDVEFQAALGFPLATPLGDSSWLQSHSV